MSSSSAWIYVISTAWDLQPPTVLSEPELDTVARDCHGLVLTLAGTYEMLSTGSYNVTIPAQTGAYVGLVIGGVALSHNAMAVPVKPPTLLVDGQQVTGYWITGPSGACASWSYETSWIDQAWPVTVGFSVPGPLQFSFFVQQATAQQLVFPGGSTSTSSTSDSSSTSTTVPSSPTSTAHPSLSARRWPGPSRGVIAGAVVAVVLVAALAYVLIRRRRRRRGADLDPEPTATPQHDTAPDPRPSRNGAVLSTPANDTMREAKLARLFPPASSSDYTQTPSASSSTGVDAAIPELYAAMRDAGFTVHTLFDHLRQRPQDQDEAARNDEAHSETLPLYEDPQRRQ